MDYVPPTTEIQDQLIVNEFKLEPNTAQYKGSDYLNAIRVERDISLDQAFEIAKSDSNIAYFCYVKGEQMVLEIPEESSFDPKNDPLRLAQKTRYIADDGSLHQGYCRVFHHGDAIFFKKEGKWLGSAPGLADTYSRQ